jgi:predicted tellurium resistance membrane protein TerC
MIVVIVVGIIASLFAAMGKQNRRFVGFCLFFVTNICWITYGVYQVDLNIMVQFGCFLLISSVGIWSNSGFLWKKQLRAQSQQFTGSKFVDVNGGSYYSAEYVEWLEERLDD